MSKEHQDDGSTVLARWDSDEGIKLVRKLIAPDVPELEFELFLHTAKRLNLNPLARQIYAIMRAGKLCIQTGIDGFRAVAQRNGCAGIDDTKFDGIEKISETMSGKNGSTWLEHFERPTSATVTVYKMVSGVRCPFVATAYWDEYYPKGSSGQMWRKMPRTMLAKCAEALAIRKAFPEDLSGIYTDTEMDQAGLGDSVIAEYRDIPVDDSDVPDEEGNAFGFVPSKWPQDTSFQKPPTEKMVASLNYGLSKVTGDRSLDEWILKAIASEIGDVSEEPSMASALVGIEFLRYSTDDQLKACLEAAQQLCNNALSDAVDSEAVCDPYEGGLKEYPNSGDRKKDFEAFSEMLGWPVFTENPNACRQAYLKILHRRIGRVTDLTDLDYELLYQFALQVYTGLQEVPVTFQMEKISEVLTNGS